VAAWSQWASAGRKAKPVTLVCGPEQVLSDEVCAAVRSARPGADIETLSAAEFPAHEIWAAATQYPEPGTERLVVIHAAEQLKTWDGLRAILDAGRDFEGVWVLAVWNTPDFPAKDGKLAPPMDWVRDSSRAQFIRCSKPSDPEVIVKWVSERLPGAGQNAAYELFTRCGENLTQTAWACEKLTRAGVHPTSAAIAAVSPQDSAMGFADALCLFRKPEALRIAATMDPATSVTSHLASNLDALSALHAASGAAQNLRELLSATRLKPPKIKRFQPVAVHYSPDRVTACRRWVAVAEDAWRHGTREGICEFLAALW
jgi:hypothetical protein